MTQYQPTEDQEKLLEDAKKCIKEHAYFMNKQLENANLRGALKHSAGLLNELKINTLTPRNYYILFMAAFDEMRELEKYFKEEFRRGRKMVDLYETVQHAPALLPRLYLLITVGSVYIQSHEEGSHKILEDLIQMLRAVQNPLRGLFLRYYFLKMCKDRLPDTGSEYETEGRGIQQAIEIIYTNLRESVYLWCRLNTGKDKARKEKDRMDLKVLIGEGLHRISSLEGVNLAIYKSTVFPKLLELLRTSKDALSQQYLLDCMIQGFPQEFHIHTLSELLNLCATDLERQVDVKLIFISLMDRLSDYASSANSLLVSDEINLYKLFKKNIDELVVSSDSFQFKNVLRLQAAFLKFTLKCYPTEATYVNEILKSSVTVCSKNDASNIDQECQGEIVKFLTLPLETLSVAILTMDEYPNLMKYLKFSKRREVATQIVKVVNKINMQLVEETLVGQLLHFIEPLLKSGNDYENISEVLFKDEQTQVSRLVFQINSEDPAIVWGVLKLLIEKFKEGGAIRQKYTYPSAIFRLFTLAQQIHHQNPDAEPKHFKKIFELVRNMIKELSEHQQGVLAFKLYLQFLSVIDLHDKIKFYDEFTYETATDCLLLYEQEANDTETKLRFLRLIIGTLRNIECLSPENYDTLITNVASYSSKILKKNEQCEILLDCTHLFHSRLCNDQQRVFQILKKCAKLANTCVGQNARFLYLFVYIINKYAYFCVQYGITASEELQTILSVYNEKYADFSKEADIAKYVAYWNRTRHFLQESVDEGRLQLAM